MRNMARYVGLVWLAAASLAAAAEDALPVAPEPGDVLPAAFQRETKAAQPIPGAVAPLASQSPGVSAASAPLPLASRREAPLPLGGSGRSKTGESKTTGGMTALVTVGSSLSIVLGVFFLFAWIMRRASPRGQAILPGEVFEVMGRAPLSGRQQVQLLRCGRKLLLVSVTPAGAETLTEVTDPVEVDRLAGMCRQAGPKSATAAFRQIFEQLAPKNPDRSGAVRHWEDDDV